MIGLVVAAMLSVDGGVAADAPLIVLEVDEGNLVVRDPNPDGGTVDLLRATHVGEGCYLPTESCIRSGKTKAKQAAKIESWDTADLKWVGTAFAAGAVVGAIITTAAILTVRK